MKASFQRKLFRLFLVFSIVPVVTLAVAGYYLTTETGLADRREDSGIDQVTGYYNDYLYERIGRALEQYVQTGTVPEGRLDFLYAFGDPRTVTAPIDSVLPQEALENMTRAGQSRDRGFVEADHRLYQWVRSGTDSAGVVYAGIVHDRGYAGLLETIRRETALKSSSRRLRSEYLQFVGVLFVVLSLLAMGGAYFFSSRLSRNLARPLQELSRASGRIAGGDFRQEVKASGEGELRTLIVSFNRMARQLDRATTRLAQTERVAAWRQVARRFAHELKNPLQPLLVSLYRIEKQLADSPALSEIHEPLKAASEEIRHLTGLADRFSHLAKLPAPALEDLDLADLARSIVSLYQQQCVSRQLVLSAPASLRWRTDGTYLREALHNLLQNAIDATGEGGRIELSVTTDAERASITVRDDGAGMDANTLAQARLPYFTTKEAGTGLGLAIVEKSISELGGQVLVESRPGHGTTVTISLPTKK